MLMSEKDKDQMHSFGMIVGGLAGFTQGWIVGPIVGALIGGVVAGFFADALEGLHQLLQPKPRRGHHYEKHVVNHYESHYVESSAPKRNRKRRRITELEKEVKRLRNELANRPKALEHQRLYGLPSACEHVEIVEVQPEVIERRLPPRIEPTRALFRRND